MGKIWMPGGGGGADTSVVTAEAGDVLMGKVIVGPDGEPLSGTMPNRGAVSYSLPINGSYTIGEGYHNGSGKVTQSIPVQGGSTTTPGTMNKTIVAANRYVNGNIIVAGSANLVPANIKKGVNIFGVVGTHSGYVVTATDLYLRGQNPAGFVAGNSSSSFYSFEAGGIIIASPTNWQRGIITTNYYNLSPYNYINIEMLLSNRDDCRINIFNNDVMTTIDYDKLGSIDYSGTKNVSKTVSLNITNVVINTKIYISFSSSSPYPKGTIYRIWLS